MNETKQAARLAGLWYLGLATTGMVGFLLLRPAIVVPDDPTLTAKRLLDGLPLARLGVLFELGIVATQTYAALSFYRLFLPFSPRAAISILVLGLMNAIALLASAIFLATTVGLAEVPLFARDENFARLVFLLFEMSAKSWSVGGLFFGLWLVPMGTVARESPYFPRALGSTLLVGAGGYLLSTLAGHGLGHVASGLLDGLALPATFGEFWMIGHLLFAKFRIETSGASHFPSAST